MKKLFYLPALMAAYMILTAGSCKRDDDSTNPSNPSVPGSGWRISLYMEPGENKTQDYNGYVFGFSSDGSMTAVRNSQTTTGTWQQFQNDGLNRFRIMLNTSDNKLSDLNHSWVLVSKNDALISLRDDNTSSNEQLQFSK